ncbi:MAG: hypothetical protein QJR08_06235 [Bacillota bacterium]|nr:hypothetical protein [Bacillota bacterium]
MDRSCFRCHEPMKRAWVNTGAGTLVLEEPAKGGPFASRKVSPVTAFVCPKCGYVEWVAEHPEAFAGGAE